MNVNQILAAQRRAVEDELSSILNRGDSHLYRVLRDAVLSGGKRFRPLLLLSSGEAFHADRTILLPFACAVELIHNYSLIHDDLPSMDNDDVRRGRPSCHIAFGEAIALLAGDALLTLAFQVMAEAPLPAEVERRRASVISEVGRGAGVEGMIEGQCLDIQLPPEGVNEDSYRRLILMKTGALIIASVKVGGLLAGAGPLELGALTDYGMNIGLAFQVRDDILDTASARAKPAQFRPNSVSLFGEEGARQRLREHVDMALGSLERASIESEELKALGQMLLALDDENGR
jgi:geranylgeranyl pyrophosphate synthase